MIKNIIFFVAFIFISSLVGVLAIEFVPLTVMKSATITSGLILLLILICHLLKLMLNYRESNE